MVSIYDVKPAFQRMLRPITGVLAKAGITPNQVTVAALLLSVGAGAAIYFWRDEPAIFLILPITLFVRMALNAIDGMLAREHDQRTKLGAILNELGDVASDAALYLPLAWAPGFQPWLVVLLVVLGIIAEMSGVVAVQIGASRRYDGPMGKSDRAFVVGALGLVLGFGLPPGWWLDLVLAVVAGLSALTIVNRSRHALLEAE